MGMTVTGNRGSEKRHNLLRKRRTGFPLAAHPWPSQHPGATLRPSHGSTQQLHKVATVLHPHFTDEEIEACGNQYLPEVTQLVSGRDSEVASLISECVLLTPTLHLWSEKLPTSKPPTLPHPPPPPPQFLPTFRSIQSGWFILWHMAGKKLGDHLAPNLGSSAKQTNRP